MTAQEPFFGRTAEIRDVQQALLSPDIPEVTITGIGGMGKTSLAARVMHLLENHFPEGVFFIPLSEFEHSAQLAPAILSALGADPGASRPEKSLIEILSRRSTLLVLDNFEHIISAATVVQALSRHSSQSKILVTSRTRLGFSGEFVYKLHGFQPSAGVRLFMASSEKQGSFKGEDTEAVMEICRRFEGVPLGIKLAASLCSGLSPGKILKLIEEEGSVLDITSRTGERRHRNLRKSFDYSWLFLDADEKQAFSSLSVFRGCFTVDAAIEVTGTTEDTFRRLWSKSLVETTPGGLYTLHPLLRDFSLHKFDGTGDRLETVKDRHAGYYCRFLACQSERMNSAESAASMGALNSCYPDLVDALHNAVRRGMTGLLNEALRPFRVYMVRRGLLNQARSIFTDALDTLADVDSFSRNDALTDLGAILTEQAVYDEAIPLLEEALESKDNSTLAAAGYAAGIVYMRTGNLKRAEAYMTMSLEHARAAARHDLTAQALSGLGDLYNHFHDQDKAEYFIRQSLELYEKTGNHMGQLAGHITLSNLMFNSGKGPQALKYAEIALKFSRSIKGDRYSGLAEVSAACAHELLGNLDQALLHAKKSVDYFEGIDLKWGMQAAYGILAPVQSRLGDDESLNSAGKLESLCSELSGTYNSMEHLITVGEIYERHGLNEKALKAYRKAEKTAANLNLDIYREKISEAIRKFDK